MQMTSFKHSNFNVSRIFCKEKNHRSRTMVFLVGVMRFELMAFCTPCKRATKLRHTPATLIIILGLFQKIKYYFQKMIKNFQIAESLDFPTIFVVKKPARQDRLRFFILFTSGSLPEEPCTDLCGSSFLPDSSGQWNCAVRTGMRGDSS